jgi:hypothetical protein
MPTAAARLLGLGALFIISVAPAAALESRTFAVSWIAPATHSQDGDCAPGGVNIPWKEQRYRNLSDLGFTKDQIAEMVKKEAAGSREIDEIMGLRGRLNGEPVNPVAYPATVKDPKLNHVTGKFAYGFDLDGKGATAEGAFQDPETKATGIDNQLIRAIGCSRGFRGTIDNPPTYWVYIWGQLQDSQPAWLITISGEDLSKDGEVTVVFDRALERLRYNIDGTPRSEATYRTDPDPRSHNEFEGTLKDGVVTLRRPGADRFRMLLNPLLIPEINLHTVHLRLRLNRSGTMDAMLGGYQPWGEIYWAFAAPGQSGESEVFGDLVGLYYLMRRFADADPDPVTGQNAGISATYHLQGVAAFAVTPPATSGAAQ